MNFLQKRDTLDAVNCVRDHVDKSSKATITVFRDAFLNSNPNLSPTVFKLSPAADVALGPGVVEDTSPQVVSNLPPPCTLEAERVDLIDSTDEDIMSAIKYRVPFSEDIEIWDTFKLKGAADLLKPYVMKNLQPGTTASTENGEYVKALLAVLFSNGYLGDHTIPPNNESAEISSFPLVPRAMIHFLHKIGVSAHDVDSKFDLERYWGYLRENFAESTVVCPIGGKPTASALYKTAQGVVAEENQVQEMHDKLPKSTFEAYVNERKEHRSPGGQVEEVANQPGDTTQGTSFQTAHDSTVIQLRNREVHASKSTEETTYSIGKRSASQRRDHEDYKIQESESATKKPKM